MVVSRVELAQIIRDLIFVAEVTETCLKTWNNGQGSPANVDGIIKAAKKLLEEDWE